MDLPVSSPMAFAFPDEGDIPGRLRRKDPDALADLYDLYGTVVYRVVLRMVNNQSAAEDIVQETFGRIWERSHQIREDAASIGPWILTIARNRALDYLRLSDVRVAFAAKRLDDMEELCIPDKDAESQFLSDEFARTIRTACNRLNDKQRRVIEMAYYQGLSQTRIAEVLDQPLGTVKSWTRSALQCLRQSLSEQGGF